MHDLKRCPNCLHKIAPAYITPTLCFNCGTEVKPHLWQHILSIGLGLSLYSLFIGYSPDVKTGAIFITFIVVFEILFLKIFGYKQKKVEILINPNTIEEENQELFLDEIPMTKRQKYAYIGQAIILFIILLVVGLLVSLALDLNRVKTGQMISLFMTISLTYFILQVLYVYKEDWYMKLTTKALQNFGTWTALILSSFAFNTTLGMFSYYGFVGLRLFVVSLCLGLSLLALGLQKVFDSKYHEKSK